MNRRSFLALLAAVPAAPYIPIRSYFFPPAVGWRNNLIYQDGFETVNIERLRELWGAKIQLYDNKGRVLADKPFDIVADAEGYRNAAPIIFPAAPDWGTVSQFAIMVHGVCYRGYFTYEAHPLPGDSLQINTGDLAVDFSYQ